MPLNYSKWDQLELSDDSDIEGHPNVDKMSLVRLKQHTIHAKREDLKAQIACLTHDVGYNKIILSRLTEISKELSKLSDPMPRTKYFSNLVEKIEKEPSPDRHPDTPKEMEQTKPYDEIVLSYLRPVISEAQESIQDKTLTDVEREAMLTKYLSEGMALRVTRVGEAIQGGETELANLLAEQHKKITMDDIHTGFDSSSVPPRHDPAPVPKTKIPKHPETETVTEFETLNPTSAAKPSEPSTTKANSDEDTEEGLPELTPILGEFSHLPLKGYKKSFEFIQTHPDVFGEGASDALLLTAFRAQSANKPKYAKKCIHQSLLLQYCEKLGPDGVRMFFNKMISGDPRAQRVFVEDVERTYALLVQRVIITKAEEEAETAGQEQIQLVAENPEVTISFNVPDGPPPEHMVLEGPGTEQMDVEDVRKVMQLRWDLFTSFPQDFQDALKTNSLEVVNKSLGSIAVPEAEGIVQKLDMAGILSFADGGIRDETGNDEGAGGIRDEIGNDEGTVVEA